MSLLLDALRKSEKRRRGGTPPPLGLPAGPGAGAPIRGGHRSRRRLGLVLLIVLCILALALAGWWGAGRPGQDRLQTWLAPTPDETVDASSAGAADDATERQLVADAYRRPTDNGGGTADAVAAPAAEPEPRAGGPVDDRSADLADSAPDDSVTARPAADPAVERTAGVPSEETPIEPGRRAVQTDPATPIAEVDRVIEARSPDTARTAASLDSGIRPADERETGSSGVPAVSGQTRDPSEPRDDTITPWELPSAARADFPAIDVAVHFYAPDASNRFVLIEGERYTEGETIADGVELAEIRRSGIVVDFQNYRVRIE